MAPNGINVMNKCFVYLKLTPIRGCPSGKATIKIKRKTFANLAAVESDYTMAQGHGHLGLGMLPEEYEVRSPGIPFIILPHPGIWLPTDQTASTANYYIFQGQRCISQICTEVTSMIRALIVEAVDDCYISALWDTITCTYSNITIRQFIEYFKQMYWHTSITLLEEERKAVEEMVFDPDAMEIQDIIVALRELQVLASTL